MRVKILRHKKDEIELEESKGNNDAVVREVGEKVGDSEGQSSDEGNMSDVWNSGDSEREESGTEEQRQKRKDLRFERGIEGAKAVWGEEGGNSGDREGHVGKEKCKGDAYHSDGRGERVFGLGICGNKDVMQGTGGEVEQEEEGDKGNGGTIDVGDGSGRNSGLF
ncbi:hypothetical protein CgunFtcFv8_007881 [Champsocephalus gunnari]|nr:hypothetical protein CgunFtcFv8_007881 [Champsocephalus gunnari]